MLKWLERALDAFVQGVGNAIADIRDKGVFEAFFGLKTPERHRNFDLGWSLDRSSGADNAIALPERGSSPSPLDTGHRSMSLTSGWDFAREPTREREGQSIER